METFVNFSVMALGLFNFFGNVGGITYLVILLCELVADWKLQRHTAKPSCQSCANCKVCAEVMAGQLPETPCAYWQKKKP